MSDIADSPPRDPWIFREVREFHRTAALVDKLRASLQMSTGKSLLPALIRCGQLESALSDAGAPASTDFAKLTDAISAAFCGADNSPLSVDMLAGLPLPETLRVSPPEGFSYYAVHPLDYVAAVRRMSLPGPFAIIGIRSIGSTLSAIVRAALRASGIPAERITVRPTGHPYQRETRFSEVQVLWLRQMADQDASFLIVDEGPGRSGSSFLSVAEALERVGVPDEKITLIGSHQPDPASLCATDATRRWQRYRYVPATQTMLSRFEDFTYFGGGYWRSHLLPDHSQWPECWPQMERMKFLSPDSSEIFKFEGLGPLGDTVRERATALAEAGFSPKISDAGDGFARYEVLRARPLNASDVSNSILRRIAEYCAFRLQHFPATQPDHSQLVDSTRFNIDLFFGIDWKNRADEFLSAPCMVVDGRMQPHEWLLTDTGHLLKSDATSHGDDHFFPGPCNVAWDLAGAVVEWNLSSEAAEYLLRQFQRLSGVDLEWEMPAFLTAYSVFRLAYCHMAMTSTSDLQEKRRLCLARDRYRLRASQLLRKQRPFSSLGPPPIFPGPTI